MKYSESLKRATTRPENFSTKTWDDERFAEQRDQDLADQSIDAKWAVGAVAFCLVVASLLSSGRLVEMAEERPFGRQRDAMVEVAHGIDRVSNFLSLNRPADLISSLRGGAATGRSVDDLADLAEEFQVQRGAGNLTPVPTPTTVPSSVSTTAVTPVPESTSPDPLAATSTTTTQPARAPIRSVSTELPLRAIVVGDSQAEIVAQSLIETVRQAGGFVTVTNEAEIGTGLARPDTFNWPAQLADLMQDRSPEVVVMMMGGNDDWDMDVDGERVRQGSDEWIEEYRFRATLMTNVATQSGGYAVWILYPPVRDNRRNEVIEAANTAIRRSVEGRDDAVVFDANTMFASDQGGYQVYFDNDLGSNRAMRADDGVHFTVSGSNWLSREIYRMLGSLWDIPED